MDEMDKKIKLMALIKDYQKAVQICSKLPNQIKQICFIMDAKQGYT